MQQLWERAKKYWVVATIIGLVTAVVGVVTFLSALDATLREHAVAA